jgi:chemotaxis protein MotB
MKKTNEIGRRTRLLALAVLAAAASMGLGGCNNKPKQQELMIADLTKENDDLRSQAQQAQDALTQAQTRVTELENENATLKQAPAAAPATADTGMSRGGGSDRILTIAGDVAFGPGSTVLTSAGKREVDKIISEIKSKYSGNRIEIAGFTDTDPLKKSKAKYTDNENLSAQRALSVERYMNSKGIPDNLTHASAYGPSNPKGSKKDSRRVEIKILAN